MKVVTVAGYLGSGKTTLIVTIGKALSEGGVQVAIIVNDVGGIPVDGKVMEEYGLTVKEIGGGCVCCQVAGNMRKTLETLHRSFNPDMVMVEPTGIAVPRSLRESALQGIRNVPVTHGPTIVLFDLTRAEKLLTYDTLKRLVTTQLRDADIIALSKTDQVAGDAVTAAREAVAGINPRAEILPLSVVSGEGVADVVSAVRGVVNA